MPNASDAAALADADGSGRVSINSHLDLKAQILGEALKAQRLGGALDNARQLGLS